MEKTLDLPLKKLYADSAIIASSLQPQLRNSFELNSVGFVLLDQGEKGKSLFVYSLNRDLYPTAANAWNGLGRAFLALNRREEAKAALWKSQLLDPENEETKRLLQKM